jgi:hypothetical protein
MPYTYIRHVNPRDEASEESRVYKICIHAYHMVHFYHPEITHEIEEPIVP